jgi:hypothetical protein
MSFLPFITVPLRFAVSAALLTLIAPFAVIYLLFSPKQAWGDIKFLLLDARDFVAEGKNDKILEDEP